MHIDKVVAADPQSLTSVDLVSPSALEKDFIMVASLVIAKVSLTPLMVVEATNEGSSPDSTKIVQSGHVTSGLGFKDEIEPSRAISKEQVEIFISTSEATSQSSVVIENVEPQTK